MARIQRFCPNCGVEFTGRSDRPNAFCSHTCAALMRRRERAIPLADRFWSKVARGKKRTCWPWLASTHPEGYGQFSREGRAVHAHRIAWELTHGLIPDGLHVLHTCDNPPCCNPDHLFLGRQAENVADMMAKGRHGKTVIVSEESHFAKLTAAQVAEIKAKLATGKRDIGRALATEYGVNEATISYIKSGKTWR